MPKLRLAHSEETIRATSSLDHWERKSTQDIVDSLRHGDLDSLNVVPDGTVMDGNSRVVILRQRGYDVDSLPSDPHHREELDNG